VSNDRWTPVDLSVLAGDFEEAEEPVAYHVVHLGPKAGKDEPNPDAPPDSSAA
jgi:hypothetical protein